MSSFDIEYRQKKSVSNYNCAKFYVITQPKTNYRNKNEHLKYIPTYVHTYIHTYIHTCTYINKIISLELDVVPSSFIAFFHREL